MGQVNFSAPLSPNYYKLDLQYAQESIVSYIVAHVKFATHGLAYAVECFRNDLVVDDEVIIRFPRRPLVVGRIVELSYLNWACSGKIICKSSETSISPQGRWISPKEIGTCGLVTSEAFVKDLVANGWVHFKPGRGYRFALTYENASCSANILIRKNGIDLQILQPRKIPVIKHFAFSQDSSNDGRFVRHHFAYTRFNLYEGIQRFANSFMADENNLDRFFTSVGTSDRSLKRPRDKEACPEVSSHAMAEMFNQPPISVSSASGSPMIP